MCTGERIREVGQPPKKEEEEGYRREKKRVGSGRGWQKQQREEEEEEEKRKERGSESSECARRIACGKENAATYSCSVRTSRVAAFALPPGPLPAPSAASVYLTTLRASIGVHRARAAIVFWISCIWSSIVRSSRPLAYEIVIVCR